MLPYLGTPLRLTPSPLAICSLPFRTPPYVVGFHLLLPDQLAPRLPTPRSSCTTCCLATILSHAALISWSHNTFHRNAHPCHPHLAEAACHRPVKLNLLCHHPVKLNLLSRLFQRAATLLIAHAFACAQFHTPVCERGPVGAFLMVQDRNKPCARRTQHLHAAPLTAPESVVCASWCLPGALIRQYRLCFL
jgi:hypothetical protein